MPEGHVYILGSPTGTLYTGVTSSFNQRLFEHRNGIKSTFASKYGCTRLLLHEQFLDIRSVISREKQIKGWTRAKKLALIAQNQPQLQRPSRPVRLANAPPPPKHRRPKITLPPPHLFVAIRIPSRPRRCPSVVAVILSAAKDPEGADPPPASAPFNLRISPQLPPTCAVIRSAAVPRRCLSLPSS